MKANGRKKKSKKKLVIGVGILVVAAVAGANIYGSRNAAENVIPQVEVVKAVRDNVQQTVETSGIVVSEEQKTYFSPVNAKIDVADVKEGEMVKAGTKLVEFDQKDLEREEKKAELNVKSGKLDMQNTLNKSAEAVQKQQNAQGNAATLKQQVAAQEDYIANIKARISQANTNAQAAAAQAAAQKEADAIAAQAAQAEAAQKAYAAAQKKYQNETLPAYQTQLNMLADEMNQAQTAYNQSETDYQMAFQTWGSEQSDENAAALDVAESARNDAQIAYQNAKSAYEDYKTQKPTAPTMNDVNGGSIKVDGHDVRNFNRSNLREMFGMVLQDTWLFSGTIMENIRYGRLDATDEEVIAAAKAAHIHNFIMQQPGGYQMVLDEETSNVSQGQKQLLTIARAILADNKILILDEATSSVDTRTEMQIQKAMDNLMKGRTSFVIAHRLSTIRDADLILVMKDGDIIEQGNHEELLARKGFYADLYNSQFEKKEAQA